MFCNFLCLKQELFFKKRGTNQLRGRIAAAAVIMARASAIRVRSRVHDAHVRGNRVTGAGERRERGARRSNKI